ncbi:DNA-binding response regulator, OmpR family, contains REC and winged-helix (wHTH) domain [Flavobacteriaceae bacterium MAR_2010_188]|nr:DNA-binding response regulator, OmpR family, contains REC and winged-helix (wHTH) domain [Flavobacteriaceae bacterium MAR_2010_188]
MLEQQPHILLIEDDEALGYLLTQYLGLKKFDITWKKDGKSGLKALDGNSYDLLILDVTLPDMDGFMIAENVKEKFPKQPFIFLTSRSMKVDTLKGFSLGAVDYLKKPIDEEELVARINVLLKLTSSEQKTTQSNVVQIGNYTFNKSNQLLNIKGQTINLTEREAEVLNYLVERKNNISDHRDLLIKIWGRNDYFNKKSLNVFISKLRKYLQQDPSISIENVHNKGFILKVDE